MTRFLALSGMIRDRDADARRTDDLDLHEAETLVRTWYAQAEQCREFGRPEVASRYLHDALDLSLAYEVARAQRREWVTACRTNEDARLARLARGVGG